MKTNCLICNAALELQSAYNIFNEKTSTGTTHAQILSEVLNTPLSESQDKYLCNKCLESSEEYNRVAENLKSLKSSLTSQYKASCQERPQPKRLVLPASKLQPLPLDYVLDVSKFGALGGSFSKIVVSPQKLKPTGNINLKVTLGTTVLTQSIKASVPKTVTNTTSALDLYDTKLELRESDDVNDELNELPMEIDEECSLLPADKSDETSSIEESIKALINRRTIQDYITKIKLMKNNNSWPQFLKDQHKEEPNDPNIQYLDVVTENGTTEKIQLRVLDDDDDENDDNDDQETIVMSADSKSILQVISGQRLVYENGKISLMADDDQQDANDSNDESQIELQVSGDEETANAIIAAAQEQGGAFIEVESGEMFRVEAIKSNKITDNGNSIVIKADDEFKCLLCDPNVNNIPFKGDAESIMKHTKKTHDARIYICKICHKIHNRKGEYLKHMEHHKTSKSAADKSKVHECTICIKKFASKSLLSEHMNIHNGWRPHTCSMCNKTFASKYTHQAHMKTHTERPRPYKCDQCPKSFLTQQNLTQHLKSHTGIKEFTCNVCGKAFATQHNLEVHGIIHSGTKPYTCKYCKKSFARKAELTDHHRIHTGERPFSCDLCGASFAQRSNLYSHKRATHLNDKRYQCDSCPKKFKRRRLLEYHIKASHTGERPLTCSFCPSTFVYHEHYKKHLRIHTGERPYTCEVCGKSFTSRDNRNTHRFTHSDKKPFECLVCGAGYMRKQLLYAHMNALSHLAESIVVNQPRVQNVEETMEVAPHDQNTTDKLEVETLLASQELEFDSIEASQMVASKSFDDQTPKIFITNDNNFILSDNLNMDPNSKSDENILQGISVEAIAEQAQLLTSDTNGDMVRLMQVKLDNGDTGWVAINANLAGLQ